MGVLCAWGSYALWRNRAQAISFNRAKNLAISGLTLGFLLWFTGFMTIGGEWFLMWQSSTWNGQQPAFRFALIILLVLLYVAQEDKDSAQN